MLGERPIVSDNPESPLLEFAGPQSTWAESAGNEDAADSSGYSGVHDVIKTVDHWFERETHQIEREADRLAADWANENLPTLNGGGETRLEPEEMLAKLCGELWQRWPERVQVKMQDAIDSASADLAKSVGMARAALVEMRVAGADLRETEQKVEQMRREAELRNGKVKYEAFLPTWATRFLTILLVAVEFIANQPVFRIIWPMQSDVAAGLSEQLERAANSGILSGLKIAAYETFSYFEATVLAFAVVVLLFVLAKSLGTSTRPIVALKEQDHPYASRSIAALHRQKKTLGAVAGVGVVAVLAFLFMSRAGATEIVEGRVKEARLRVSQIQQLADSLDANGDGAGSTTILQLSQAQDEVFRLDEQLAFAKTVESNNVAIVVLNISLVCFAFVVGFMGDKRDLTDVEGEHPDFQRLREKCTKLHEQIVRYANQAREHVTQGQLAESRLASLHRSRPLATLDAKRARLDSIIPRWRTTNARLRGLDPVSIAAFRRPEDLALPQITRNIQLVRPETVDSSSKELKDLIPAIYGAERGLVENRGSSQADVPAHA